MPRYGRWLTLPTILVLVIISWAGIKASRKDAPGAAVVRQEPAPVPVAVSVAAVTAYRGKMGVYLTGLGAVTPLYAVTVKSRVDGQILNVYYQEGQAVGRGDPLIEIDSRPYEVQLAQAEGQFARDKSALDNAQTDLQRYEALLARNAISQQTAATQRATVQQYQAVAQTDEANIAAVRLDISYCHITAPIDGRIGLRLLDPGNMVSAFGGQALVVIAQISPISVIFTIPDQQVPEVLKRVRAGQRLLVDALDGDSKKPLAHGELTTLDNQIDPTTGTLRLRALFANKDEALFPNQFVNAQLLVEEKQKVTLVPNTAIQRNGSSTFVYLIRPDRTVTARTVTVGNTNAEESEITSGVAPGDVMVTQGVDRLQEGTLVDAAIQPAGNKAAPSTLRKTELSATR